MGLELEARAATVDVQTILSAFQEYLAALDDRLNRMGDAGCKKSRSC
jgi:hypothetical protein